MSGNGPEPRCAICRVRGAVVWLRRHGQGAQEFFLCAVDDAKADECFGTHDAAALSDAANMAQG